MVLAGWLYAIATAVVVGFQVGLAAGAPWGDRAMGGRYPGRLPLALRIAAAVQALVLAVLAVVVLDAAGVLALGWTASLPWLAWVPVLVAAAGTVLNATTRSAVERRTWLPVALVLLLCCLRVAVG